MNEKNIMENEVIETTEEIVSNGSGNYLKVVGGTLAIVGVAYGIYKFYKKRKINKEQQYSNSEVDNEKVYSDVDNEVE